MSLYPPNEKSRKEPKQIKFTTWDIETYFPENPKLVDKIGFYDGNNYISWDNYTLDNEDIFEKFLGKVLSKKYYGFNHYAHFGGKFDFIYMLDVLKNYNYQFDIIDVNGRILEIEVYKNSQSRQKGKTFHFRDSYVLMPKSLKSITESFSNQITHLKLYQDFEEKESTIKTDVFSCLEHHKTNCLDCYLKNDVLGLYESLNIFQKIINSYNGEIKLTIASTSINIFKNQYLKTILNSLDDIKIGDYKGEKDIILKTEDLVRDYYFGGRCEIFKRYGEFLYYYDINSLYPYVMLQPMPISKPMFALPENINLQKDTGFIYTDVEFYKDDITPLIPYKLKNKNNKKLIYPKGFWSCWLDLDMYRKALTLGYKFDIKYGIIFNAESIFKDFINDFYDLRSLNDSMKLIAKLIMNSLYGKFAQKRIRKQIIKYLGIDEETLKDLIPYNLDENLYQKESISKSKHIIPSISAHITTLAQLELYKYFELIGHNQYYTDTDSFITDTKLNTSKKLGDIKLEYEIDRAVFLLPKTYCIDYIDMNELSDTYGKKIEKVTMKGFIKNQFSFDDFYHSAMTNDFSKFQYQIKKLWGFKESLNRNNTFLTYDAKINSLKNGYNKRIILEDKINTIPLTINQGIIV